MQQCNCPECERARIVNAGGGLHGSFLLVEPDKRIDFHLVVRMEDEIIHTEEKLFCDDKSCPCHSIDNFEAVWRLKTQLAQGLITWDEHIRIWRGETI